MEDESLHIWLLLQPLNKLAQCPISLCMKVCRHIPTNRATIFLFVRECMSIDTFLADVHHIVIKIRIRTRHNLQRFITARRGDDCVSRCDGWNDVFHHTLRHRVCYARNIEFSSTPESLFVQPLNMFWIVIVELFVCRWWSGEC